MLTLCHISPEMSFFKHGHHHSGFDGLSFSGDSEHCARAEGSPACLLLIAEGDDGVDAHGAMRGKETSCQAYRDDEGCDCADGPWIRRRDAPNLACYESRETVAGE